MSQEDQVRDASRSFYAALNRMLGGDSSSMADIWSHGDRATAMHPIGGRNVGWASVDQSFAQVAGLAESGHVALKEQQIQVLGDAAYELGIEEGEAVLAGETIPIGQRVTNVYQREGGGWKIVHHHTDISPAMRDLVSRL